MNDELPSQTYSVVVASGSNLDLIVSTFHMPMQLETALRLFDKGNESWSIGYLVSIVVKAVDLVLVGDNIERGLT